MIALVRPDRRPGVAAVVVVSWLAVVVVLAMARPAAAERAGDLEIVDASGAAIGTGGPEGVVVLRPPAGAACQGDSASGGYRVSTFLVPSGTDPGGLEFGELRPLGEGNWSIWTASTDPAVKLLTGVSGPGLPGPLVDLPAFTFDVGLLPGEIAPGEYLLGLACTLDDRTTRFWDVPFVVLDDETVSISWSTPIPADADASGAPPTAALLALGALLVVGTVLAFRVRRRAAVSPPTLSTLSEEP